jgi:hypothetical protein
MTTILSMTLILQTMAGTRGEEYETDEYLDDSTGFTAS